MATKTLYFKNVTVSGALSLQDGGTAPTGALTATGWTVAKLASPNFSLMAVGTKQASGTFSSTDALTTPSLTAGSSWRSENPMSGTFANTNWSLAFRIRASSSASSQTGAVKIRIWKSPNLNGSGGTQLTTGILTGTTTAALSTTVSATSTVTWPPGGTITLTNEYLFVQCEWSIVTASGSNNGDALFYVESAGAITTSDFVASVTGTLAVTETADTAAFAGQVVIAAALATTEAGDTAAFQGQAVLSAQLAVTEAQDTANFNVTILDEISGTFAVTEAQDIASFQGTAGDITGTLAVTEAADVAAFAGQVVISAQLAATEAKDVLAFAGQVVIAAALAASESPDVASFTGQVVIGAVLGTTEAQDTANFAANLGVMATLAVTEAQDTANMVGQLGLLATLSATEAADIAAFAAVIRDPIMAALAVTEASDQASFAAQLELQAILAATEPPDVARIDVFIPPELFAVLETREAQDVMLVRAKVTGRGPHPIPYHDYGWLGGEHIPKRGGLLG